MNPAIHDAYVVLQRHPALTNVSAPAQGSGRVEISAMIDVSLPCRVRAAGVTSNGIRQVEPCWFVFPEDWPLAAPTVWLREDFPLNLPHINPHRPGERVHPCLFEGPPDELVQSLGLDGIIDQLSDWLTKAASGQLIDLEQGWEPTRRDSLTSGVIFSAEEAVVRTPIDGSLLVTQGVYFSNSNELLAVAVEGLPELAPRFTLEYPETEESKYYAGNLPIVFARCVDEVGNPQVVSSYSPEEVHDFSSLLEKARDLGARSDALERFLTGYAKGFFLENELDEGISIIVVLLIHRPADLIGAPGRNIEVLPYAVRFRGTFANLSDEVYPAYHSHSVSPDLLSMTSGRLKTSSKMKIVMLGCGSLGSKIALHLGRSGIGNIAFVDNETMSPHNGARHALIPPRTTFAYPGKASMMERALNELGHTDCVDHLLDAKEPLLDRGSADDVFGTDEAVIIDTTASLAVAAASIVSPALSYEKSPRRLLQAGMYAQGKVAYLFSEGAARNVMVCDLQARLFEMCRHSSSLRKNLQGEGSDLTNIFVGDNCRSLTMPMADSKVSRAAALISGQIESWLAGGLPGAGQLCVGVEDDTGVGMTWLREQLGPTLELVPANEGGQNWKVRVLSSVAESIDEASRSWGPSETGGALLGHISTSTRTIIVAGLVDAPPDSVRTPATFTLGVQGLVAALQEANETSLGHLHYVGTWHSHPMGGGHSDIDQATLGAIAQEFQGVPAISLVWRPEGFIVAVEQV
ncbi:ThiF family adenylyltransferase [Thalassolituus sp. UBA3500]|uniref:ThiF family adenylyltransferase n=1 Tax=Thalassolituus sp. UBA3500 TaxID=1947664 RepID=UPI000C1183B2|nr:ThiF family adenylyltransferase [Thalassolituus sp. UBA3500]MBN58552.1 thiamine biosynthesis protein ThiF [Oceanospirillaceae bacterium]|tara:strand:+ start:29196 stop:31436 length:2241 start_codon:yes stop_codon:yes gene_type:complete